MSIIRYAHLRTITEKGGLTIAYHSESKDAPTIRYAIAECSKKDVFDKAKGRLIAEGRLNKKGIQVNVESHKHRVILSTILHDLLDYIDEGGEMTKTSKHVIGNELAYLEGN